MPASVSCLRAPSFSDSPLRRAGLSITRTLTPRLWAAITVSSSVGSVNRNIRMLSRCDAEAIASTMGLAVSSGRTISWWDMGAP